MENPTPAQPEPKKSNTLLIVIIAIAVACCCGIAIIVTMVALGGSLLDFSALEKSPEFLPETESLPYEEHDPTIPQGGLGNNALRRRVWDFITPMAEEDANCQEPDPVTTVIVVIDEPEDGVWREGWTVSCSNDVAPVYHILYSTNPDGTINFSPGLQP